MPSKPMPRRRADTADTGPPPNNIGALTRLQMLIDEQRRSGKPTSRKPRRPTPRKP